MSVQALSPGMSLSLASQTISRMLRARVHRHREGQVIFFSWTFARSLLAIIICENTVPMIVTEHGVGVVMLWFGRSLNILIDTTTWRQELIVWRKDHDKFVLLMTLSVVAATLA